MRTCQIDVDGKRMNVALDQLPSLVSRGLVGNDSVAWVNGKVFRVGELLRQIEVSAASDKGRLLDQLVIDDLPDRFSTQKSSRAIPLSLGFLVIFLIVILGFCSIFTTGKGREDSVGVDEKNKAPASPMKEPSDFDFVPFHDMRQTEEDEEEVEPKKVFLPKANNEFSEETDDGASKTKESSESKDAKTWKRASDLEEWEEWLEERWGDSSNRPKPVASALNSIASASYSSVPFEGNRTSVPSDYLGHDLGGIVESLRRFAFRLPNSSSQSPRWFQEREVFLSEESLYGSLKFGSRLAFVMKNASENGVNFKETIKVDYQESTKTMTVRRSFKFSHKDSRLVERAKDRVTVYFTLFVQNNYAYGLALQDFQKQKRSDLQYDHWTLTDVSPEDYIRLKDRVRVLCVFQLGARGGSYSGFSGPFRGASSNGSYYDSYRSDEVFAFPFYAISSNNTEFWLYDGKTGEILAKYSEDDFFKGRRFALPKTLKKFADSASKTTWRDVLREAVEPTESWETKKPSITIPDDAASLEEALSKSHDGDVILIRSTDKPIPLKGKKAARGESSEVLIDHAVAVVGESNVTVEIDAEETLRIDSRDLVAFKGLSFSARKSPSANSVKPLIAVANDSKVKFKDCEFQGNDIEETTGDAVEGEFANVSFWKCQFQQFGDSGVRVQDSANATLEYCQFLSKNRYGVSSFSGAAIKVDKCRFDGNVTGFIAEGGGGVVASNSFFSGNRSNWSISSGSKDASDTKEGNVIEK